jgi:hypothetical protein
MRSKTVLGAAVLPLLGATYPAAAQMMPGGAWQGFMPVSISAGPGLMAIAR